jgi:hypothetical protein
MLRKPQQPFRSFSAAAPPQWAYCLAPDHLAGMAYGSVHPHQVRAARRAWRRQL